jgi:deferrochelatase/peroxidase EfeB
MTSVTIPLAELSSGSAQLATGAAQLELDDVQHFLLARTPALAARYEFLSFDSASAGQTWLRGMIDKVGTASTVGKASPDARWVTVAFTWNGLRALGIDEAALSTFPEEFRQGFAARAEMLGLTGESHSSRWDAGLIDPAFHAIVILFARDATERERCERQHADFLAGIDGVRLLSSLDMHALPPYGEPREHFGYLDRLTHPSIEGLDDPPTPGSIPAVKPGEFFLGYPDESGGGIPALPKPEALTRNGSFLAYVRIQEHVGAFRDFLRTQGGPSREEQELMAAKLMGRWRSGAPLVLCPDADDPALGKDLQRTNDFNYGKMDPHGYGCPVGAHIRRMNPRDTTENLKRHQIIRRGGTYGELLPEGAADDGADRGIAAFNGCASLVRQFEFAMNVWANDPNFHGLENERDPFAGTHDGTYQMAIPKRPIRKKIAGIPAFTTIRAGAYLFLPGIGGLRFLADSPSQ